MVINMAGRANRAKRPPVASDAIVVLDLCCRLKAQVLMPVIRRHPTYQLGACCLGEARRRLGLRGVPVQALTATARGSRWMWAVSSVSCTG